MKYPIGAGYILFFCYKFKIILLTNKRITYICSMETNKNTSKKLAEKLYTIAASQSVENTGRGDAIRRMANIIDLHIRNQQEEASQEQTLLPFDLGLVKQGAKVVTRDGRDVEIVADDLSGEYPLLAIITGGDGHRSYGTFTIGGKFVSHPTPHDLFILKETETLEIQIWKDKNDGSYKASSTTESGYCLYYESDCELIKTINVTV